MRFRPLIAVSTAAVAALLLAGCTGGSDPADTASPSATAAPADLCDAGAASGAASDAVTVQSDAGAQPTASFTAPLTVDALQRTVVSEGTGDAVQAGDYLDFGIVGYDAETGEALGSFGYTPGEALPTQISPDSPFGQIFGCATVGSRIVAAIPASDQSPAEVFVVDLLDIAPLRATGADQAPVAGFPTVTLADDGAPTLDVAGVATPTTTQVEVLKKGDGETVAAGDQVLVQYTGALVSDGTVFDSSWANGAPVSFSTTGVVTGFAAALTGQTVGSQVVAVIPPAEGYGDQDAGGIPPGSTLAFVVDILAVAHAAPAQ